MRLTNYQQIENGSLKHRNFSYSELAEEYGTPLYIFDETSFIERIKAYKKAIKTPYYESEILFASKSLLTLAVARIVGDLGIGQDVVSAGEIYTGLKAGVNPSKMYFHGNNKLDSELQYAIESNVGTIVVDNMSEARRLNKLNQGLSPQRIIVRLNPGIEASTHDYIMTANNDSKFGLNVHASDIDQNIQEILEMENINLAGFHSHIGSQIVDGKPFFKNATVMLEFCKDLTDRLGFTIEEINFGGGFGVYYSDESEVFDVPAFLEELVDHIHQEDQRLGLGLEKITFEPGRSLVNESGSTLYRVGDLKTTINGLNYIFVDGGMADNLRPALYQAEYEAELVDKVDEEKNKTYTISGKACESGDMLVEGIDLAEAETGDLLLVNRTGAYNFTMANNYNYMPRPAMVHITDAGHYLTVKRDSFEDLIRNQI